MNDPRNPALELVREERESSWPDPEPLEATPPELPAFPTDAIPHWLSDFVTEEARATQTPPDLAALLALAAVATGVQGKAVVAPKKGDPGYTEPMNIFVVVALPPASRKSAVFRDATQPIIDVECQMRDTARDLVARAEARLQILRDAIDAKQRNAKNPKTTTARADELASEIAELTVQLARDEEACPRMPRLLVSDITPQALGMRLAEHGVLTLATAEGSEVFETARGRYSADARPNFDVLKKAHAGDWIAVDRVKGEPLRCDRPALTLALAIQPAVLRDARAVEVFRGEGLLGRFLFALPQTLVGSRTWDQAGVRPRVRDLYDQMIRKLIEIPRPAEPWVLTLDDQAEAALRNFHDRIECQLSENAALGWMTDWAGKLPGLTVRIAGLLHCVEWLDSVDQMFIVPIDRTTATQAIQIAEYALAHAQAALLEAPEDKLLADARYVWGRILLKHREEGNSLPSTREIHRWAGGGGKDRRIPTATDTERVLHELEIRGYAQRHDRKKGGPLWEMNPKALRASAPVSTVSVSAGGTDGSEN
ncbi:MAG: DUF3987 domain-containing protein [bacterium]|nr:DUF3987 domain-containing protein [bacterium]